MKQVSFQRKTFLFFEKKQVFKPQKMKIFLMHILLNFMINQNNSVYAFIHKNNIVLNCVIMAIFIYFTKFSESSKFLKCCVKNERSRLNWWRLQTKAKLSQHCRQQETRVDRKSDPQKKNHSQSLKRTRYQSLDC